MLSGLFSSLKSILIDTLLLGVATKLGLFVFSSMVHVYRFVINAIQEAKAEALARAAAAQIATELA